MSRPPSKPDPPAKRETPPTDDRRLLRTREAALYLGISERSLWTLCNSGQIPAVRFGSGRRQSVRFDIADLDHWIESCKEGGGSR